MRIVRRRDAMAALASSWRRQGLTVGFVPTMGALHRGHAALIERARRECDRVAVSIFVNPLQFGPHEDFNRYPRAFPADARLCRAAGADAVYHPSVEQVYPDGFVTAVEVGGGLTQVLEGAFRPGHFRGVATVVLKLLQTAKPTTVYFGEKDWQQLAVIRRMAADLELEPRIQGCATVREKDGLALSSRNAYLSPAERGAAPAIHAALKGSKGSAAKARRAILAAVPGVKIDYVALADEQTLQPATKGRLRLLAAVRVGKTRLIDNIPVVL